MKTQIGYLQTKPQQGFSMFLVLGLLLMTTIVTTAVYQALNQSNLSSKNVMEAQSADAAAKAGKAASEAFMQYNAGEIAAIIHQFLKNQEAASPGAAVPPIEIPLEQMGASQDQNFRVSLVDLNVTQPIEVKIQSEGFAADGSKKVLTSVYYLKGIYFEDLSITTGDIFPGDADGSELQDAIWGGGNTTLCGAVRLGSAAVPSSLYAGEDFDVNNVSDPDGCSGNPIIDGSVVIGYGTGTSTINGLLDINGDFYTGGEVNHGGGGSSSLTVNGNVQIMNDWNVVNGTAALYTPGDVYVKGDISSGGAGSMVWQINGGSLKIDGSLAGSFYGTNKIQGYNYDNFGNDASWDLDIDATSATSSGAFGVTGLWIENIQSNFTDPNNLIHPQLVANHNTANPIDSADIDIDDIVAQINAEGEKDHPFHVKADMEAKYSKTWEEWVDLCAELDAVCSLDAGTIGGPQINTLVNTVRAAGDADELFVDGAPMINANDMSLNFVGGQLIEKVIIRKDNNAKGVITLLPHTASTLGNPGGNLTFLSSGNYYDFHTNGNTNLLVYANGDHFEYKDISGGGNDILFGNITAKDASGGELKIHGAPTINFSPNVINASFSGGIFSKGAEEDAVITSSSSTITSIALDDRIRLEAPTLNIQFMGSFVNQVSVVEQQSLDASTLQTAKPFLTFNRQTILSLKDVYTDFDEMRAALGIVPIYSYRGESSNCTTPSDNDYYSADFEGANDSTFTVSLTINCSYQGDTVSATSSIWVTMGAGSGAPNISSVAVSSVAGSSTNTSSVGTSSDASSSPELSSSDAVSSSATPDPVCTKLPMTVLGLSKGGTRTNPARIGQFNRTNHSYDYEVMLKPDLSGMSGTINSAELIIDWGASSIGTPEMHIQAYPQNNLSSWDINSRYNDFNTSSWATGNTLFADDDVTNSRTGELIMHNVGTHLIEWVSLYSGDPDNMGIVLISEPAHYSYYKTVNAAYLNVCSTTFVTPVSSVAVPSSSSVAVSSLAVSSSSSVEVSSEAATYTITVDASVPTGVDCYVNQSTTSGLADGSTFYLDLVCSGGWAAHVSTYWKVDGTATGDTGASSSVLVDNNKTIKAYVSKLPYSVSVNVDPAGSATPMATKTVDALDATNISLSLLGNGYTMYGWVHDRANTSLITSETILDDVTYTAILKAPASDCDGSGDYNSGTSYAVGTHVKHSDKLWQCNKYQECNGVTPGSNGSIWIEEVSCAAVNTCTAYRAGICAWNGSSYACPSDKMSDDGTTAWRCNGGAYCQFGPSYAGNAWGAWSSRGSCF